MENYKKILRNKELNGTEKMLLMFFVEDESTKNLSNRVLGSMCGITGVTVSNTIKSLLIKGYIGVSYADNGLSREVILTNRLEEVFELSLA